MKIKISGLLLILLCAAVLLPSCTGDKSGSSESTEAPDSVTVIYISVGETELSAILADNSSATAFKALLESGDLTVDMHDYGNFEKVGDVGTSLPENNEEITAEPGDIILYQGNSVTIYYGTNSWNFTRLGKILNADGGELKELLGDGDVSVTFSLNSATPDDSRAKANANSANDAAPASEPLAPAAQVQPAANIQQESEGQKIEKFEIAIEDKHFKLTLYDNASAEAFKAMLPLTLSMGDLNGNEKYYYLDESLPSERSNPRRINSGDFMLYGSDCLVLFYESFSTSYSYTPLGRVDDPSGLRAALGGGSVTVTFSTVN